VQDSVHIEYADECNCKANVTDTFHIIRNLNDMVTLEGEFKNNRLYNGTCYKYLHDTTLIQKAIYEKGEYRYDVYLSDYPSCRGKDGYNKLYNSQKQLWKDGEFKKCQLWNGKQYLYDKNGLLHRIIIYKEGKYRGDGQLD
jgi:antitoxin component YwqK of YwqJK toxin-antitoxin module